MLLQRVLFVGAVWLCSSALYAITLKEALVLSLENDPATIERINNFNASREAVDVAKSEYYPRIDLYGGVGSQDISNADTQFQKSTETVYDTTIEMQQNLFNGFATSHRVASEEAHLKAAAYRYVHRLNSTAYELVKNYIDVIKYRELLQMCVESIEQNRVMAKEIGKRYQTGAVGYASVQKSEASLAQARSYYYAISERYKKAQHGLKKSMGWNVDPQTLEAPKQILQLPATRSDAMQLAIRNNPLVRVADAEFHAAQEAYKQTQGAYYPKVDAIVRQAFNSNRNGIVGDVNDFSAMVTLSYNLYRGGADSALQQQHVSKLSQKVAYRNHLKRQIMERCETAWSRVETLLQQLRHLEKFETYAQEAYRLYMQEYRHKEADLLDLITAHNDLLQAQHDRIARSYELLQARYKILDVTGTMVETVLSDTDALYAKVGIAQDGIARDTLPLRLDSDGDGYDDRDDLCQNSPSPLSPDRYGCSKLQQQAEDTAHLHVNKESFIERLMQYEAVPKERLVTTPPAPPAPPAALTQEDQTDSVQPNVSRSVPLEGHVIILGSFQTKAAAEAFAMQFDDTDQALLVIEATKHRYNLKLVAKSRPKALKLLQKVRMRVSDAWYAGKQRIVSYSIIAT